MFQFWTEFDARGQQRGGSPPFFPFSFVIIIRIFIEGINVTNDTVSACVTFFLSQFVSYQRYCSKFAFTVWLIPVCGIKHGTSPLLALFFLRVFLLLFRA